VAYALVGSYLGAQTGQTLMLLTRAITVPCATVIMAVDRFVLPRLLGLAAAVRHEACHSVSWVSPWETPGRTVGISLRSMWGRPVPGVR
jgi:hypothetical protein